MQFIINSSQAQNQSAAAWRSLDSNLSYCIVASIAKTNSDVTLEGLINENIFPNDPRLTQIYNDCNSIINRKMKIGFNCEFSNGELFNTGICDEDYNDNNNLNVRLSKKEAVDVALDGQKLNTYQFEQENSRIIRAKKNAESNTYLFDCNTFTINYKDSHEACKKYDALVASIRPNSMISEMT